MPCAVPLKLPYLQLVAQIILDNFWLVVKRCNRYYVISTIRIEHFNINRNVKRISGRKEPFMWSGISNAISVSLIELEINECIVFNTKSWLLNSFEDRK